MDCDGFEFVAADLRLVTLSCEVSVAAAFGSACTRAERLRDILPRFVTSDRIGASVCDRCGYDGNLMA